MKSKQDMQKVVLALAMATCKGELNEDEKQKVRKAMDVLLWVMDYPNNFKKFAEPVIKDCPIDDDKVDEMFDEAVQDYNRERTVTE